MPVTSAIVGPTCQPAPPSAATSEKYSSSGWATTGRAKVSTKFSGGIRFSGGKDASRVVLDSNLDSDEQEGNVLESQSKCPKTRKWSPNPFIWLTRLAARNTSKRHQAILNSDSTTEVIKIKPKHALAVSQCNNDKQEEPPDWAEPFIRASSSTPRVMWMSQLQCWEMDIFEVQNATNPPLQLVGLKIFHHHDLIGRLNLDKQRLSEFLLCANNKYLDNPYHNALHGADVCQAMHCFLSNCGKSSTNAASLLQPWQVMGALVAALCHDIGHGGVNNAFLEKTNHPLALTYSYTSTLERMHCAEIFRLLADDRCNFLEHFDSSRTAEVRRLLVSMILATDMAAHSSIMQSFEELILQSNTNGFVSQGQTGGSPGSPASFSDAMLASEDSIGMNAGVIVDLSVPKVYTHILSVCLHAADISHSARRWEIHGRWTTMIISEFHQQGDLEKGLDMPISPGCNRTLLESDEFEMADKSKIIAKGQLFFGSTFVRPLFEKLDKLQCFDLKSILNGLDENIDRWSKVLEYGSAPGK